MSSLTRSLSLAQASAINVIDMVGIGPFVALSFVMSAMGGAPCMLAWLLGALLSMLDGFTWAQLGSALPKAGGSYIFLQKLYGENRWGRLFSFLYIWQTSIQAPLVIASGAIGFATYFNYVYPVDDFQRKCISGALVVLIVALLYRKIGSIGNISLMLSVVVMGIMLWLIASGWIYDSPLSVSWAQVWNVTFDKSFFTQLNEASLKTIYCFLGYYNVCHLGGEIKNPQKNIPRSIFISIAIITCLYLAMQWSVLRVISVNEAASHEYVVSMFFEKIYNRQVALFATGGILIVAFSSLFAVVLGYSRVPYAAAVDGNYFKIFAKLHPRLNFPYMSLLILGSIAFVFSLLFKMKEIISAIIVVRILIQFVSQALGIIIFNKNIEQESPTFKMPLFPLPAILSIIIWLYIFGWSQWVYIAGAFVIIITGVILFLILSYQQMKWPFLKNEKSKF